MRYNDRIETYIEESLNDTVALIKTLCLIPSPSYGEREKAEYIKKWLDDIGAVSSYIDSVNNVILPINCDESNDIIVFMAHTDTVFPFDTLLEWKEDGDKYYCPSVGDDTCCLAIMLIILRYIIQNDVRPKTGILFVANSCEEGLGNLQGTRQIMNDFAGRVKEFYTFDGQYTSVADRCVGSHRYSIECVTEGGHSYSNFGNSNAIVELSKLIADLYSIELPQVENTHTTYNVGLIEGGTYINTIAESAKMFYEYRSDDVTCLEYMKKKFNETIEVANKNSKANINVNVVGMRPCGRPKDLSAHQSIVDNVIKICEKYSGVSCVSVSESTDCNIPLSQGIPAICVGLYSGAGEHTKEEYIIKSSIPIGLRIAAELILSYFM